jgi:uncharacterized protein (DUF1778 family)
MDLNGVPAKRPPEGAEQAHFCRLPEFSYIAIDLSGDSPYTLGRVWKEPMRHAAAIDRRSRKAERLEARVTLEQKKMIARAAALRGSSVTEFVVASAQQAAAEAIKDAELLTLHDEARDVFVNAVLHPPAPNEAARKAAQGYKERVGR